MKANIVLIVVVIAILIGVTFIIFNGGKNSDQKNIKEIQSSSTLSSDRVIHDFGEIDIMGGKVITEFTLTNNGHDKIVIIGGTTSCGCTNGEIDGIGFGMHEEMRKNLTIPAGESKILKVIFDPLAHGPSGVGLVQRSVFIKTNSITAPELEIRIKAMVTKMN